MLTNKKPVVAGLALVLGSAFALTACSGGTTSGGTAEDSSSMAPSMEASPSASASMMDPAANLVGPGCADYAAAVPSGAGSVEGMAADPVAVAASNNPLLKTLTAAVSGQLNPNVNLVDNRIITEQSGIYTSGGANSYWNLLLHLVEKYTSRELAILAAKFFVLDIDKKSQSPFTIFHGQKLHEDDTIRRAQEYIESNYTERIGIDELCRMLGIGRRTFERRFRRATNNSVVEYIQRVKIEAAKRELLKPEKRVSEIAFEVGYQSLSQFNRSFARIVGTSPTLWRKEKFAEV